MVLGLTVVAPVPPLAAEAPSVTIIHKGKAITVAASAVPAHLAHGDPPPVCDPTVPPGCGDSALSELFGDLIVGDSLANYGTALMLGDGG